MNDKSMDDEERGMDPVAMQSLYAKTLYRLRETRKALLARYGVADEAALLERIKTGEVDEHPGYDHYLSALILEQGRMQLREEAKVHLSGLAPDGIPAVSLHLMFKERIEEDYAARLAEPVRLAQDALLLSFDSGLMMEVRYADADAFSLHWTWGDAELRMDTAPVHEGVSGFPRHLHKDGGSVVADPAGMDDPDPWRAFSSLLDKLLADPLLGTE